jgi:hypothetical protein
MITAHRLLNQPALTRDAIENLVKHTATIIDDRFGVPILPLDGQTVGVALDNPKTAALFFDRVWSMPGIQSQPPASIHVYGATPYEMWIVALFALAPDAPLDIVAKLFPENPTATATPTSRLAARDIAHALVAGRQVSAVPVYSNVQARGEEYQAGKHEVLVAALANLQIPDESALTWDQVIQFRQDPEAKASYRRLVHWADKELVGKSTRFIEDEMAVRLEAYDQSLRAHGIKTWFGVLEAMLEPNFLVGTGAIVGSLAFGGSLPAAEVTGAILFGGKIACKLARSALDIHAAKYGSEIAFVHEVIKVSEK